MSMIRCRCGKSEVNFVKLTPKDVPNGYEGECCVLAAAEPALPEPSPETTPEADAAKNKRNTKTKKTE